MKLKIKSIFLILVIAMLVTGCGSAFKPLPQNRAFLKNAKIAVVYEVNTMGRHHIPFVGRVAGGTHKEIKKYVKSKENEILENLKKYLVSSFAKYPIRSFNVEESSFLKRKDLPAEDDSLSNPSQPMINALAAKGFNYILFINLDSEYHKFSGSSSDIRIIARTYLRSIKKSEKISEIVSGVWVELRDSNDKKIPVEKLFEDTPGYIINSFNGVIKYVIPRVVKAYKTGRKPLYLKNYKKLGFFERPKKYLPRIIYPKFMKLVNSEN